MKTNFKKGLSSLVMLTILLSALAGCSSSKNSKDSSSETGTPSGTPVTLNVEVFDRGVQGQPSLDDNQWTRYINEKFGKANNVNVKFIPVTRTQEVDKLNILMSSGEAPDICFTYDQATVSKYIKNGGITELDDLLKKYGSALTGYLGEDVLKYGKFGGKQMAVVAKRNMVANGISFIRQDWLDKLGLPVPKTREELYNTLVAFKTKNPGGVNGVIPWGTAVSGSGSMYGFGNVYDSFYPKQTEQDFATQPGWVKNGNKEAVKFLNKLFNEKLISQDFALDKTGKQADADVTNGKVGFFCSLWDYPYRTAPGLYATLKKNVPTAVLTPVDVFQNSEGKYQKNVWPAYGMYIIIPKSSKNAVQAIKYLNWMADPQNIFYLQNGEEGVNHKLVDGLPQPILQTGDKMIMSTFNNDYEIITNGAELNDKEKNAKLVTMGYGASVANDVAKALNVGTKDGVPSFYFDTPNESSVKYSKTLGDMSTDMTSKLIYCKPDEFDKLYDSLVAEYMTAGGQAVMDENIKIYKAMQANKK